MGTEEVVVVMLTLAVWARNVKVESEDFVATHSHAKNYRNIFDLELGTCSTREMQHFAYNAF